VLEACFLVKFGERLKVLRGTNLLPVFLVRLKVGKLAFLAPTSLKKSASSSNSSRLFRFEKYLNRQLHCLESDLAQKCR
jgi:hypothetical protein